MSDQNCDTSNEQKQSCDVPKEEQKQSEEKKSWCGIESRAMRGGMVPPRSSFRLNGG